MKGSIREKIKRWEGVRENIINASHTQLSGLPEYLKNNYGFDVEGRHDLSCKTKVDTSDGRDPEKLGRWPAWFITWTNEQARILK